MDAISGSTVLATVTTTFNTMSAGGRPLHRGVPELPSCSVTSSITKFPFTPGAHAMSGHKTPTSQIGWALLNSGVAVVLPPTEPLWDSSLLRETAIKARDGVRLYLRGLATPITLSAYLLDSACGNCLDGRDCCIKLSKIIFLRVKI